LPVSATRGDGGGPRPALNIEDVQVSYTEPALIEFDFTLTDSMGDIVSNRPAEFDLTAREGPRSVSVLETGLLLRRGAARQFKAFLVLDYSLSMQVRGSAIEMMEMAAQNEFLDELNEDAQVGVVEFHNADVPPEIVVDFTVDKELASRRIDRIQDDFVGIPAGAAQFDAMLLAIDRFEANPERREARFIIVFTDGTGVSSVADANDVIDAALEKNIRVIIIGFGNDEGDGFITLNGIANDTDGIFFEATSVNQLDDTFEEITENLGGQYTVRWASPLRSDVGVFPSITLELDDETAQFTAADPFVGADFVGDPMEGLLRFVTSTNDENATVFLRADYVPRAIEEISIFLQSSMDFTVDLASTDADDVGLLRGWDLDVMDMGDGGKWITASDPGNPIPFATLGPLLRFDFMDPVSEDQPFDIVCVDNMIYQFGQSFVIVNASDDCDMLPMPEGEMMMEQ